MQPILTTSGLSVVVPVYGNESSIPQLLETLKELGSKLESPLESVFVIDGSPDRSLALLQELLPPSGLSARVISLTRNFGAFSAIRVGLEHSNGNRIAVMAADLQEPPELILQFDQVLRSGDTDIVLGVREGRADPLLSRVASSFFWAIYRRFVIRDIPKGGVDIFALSAGFRDKLLQMGETNSSLLAQLFWIGGRRAFVGYQRRPREHGKSAWTLRKKFKYLSDSVFAFTDLPVRLLLALGLIALVVALILSAVTLAARAFGLVEVPGYAGTMLTVLFFGAFNSLGLGVVGTYAWRAFENTKGRPLAVVHTIESFNDR